MLMACLFVMCNQHKSDDSRAVYSDNPPAIEFDTLFFDFGNVTSGEKLMYSFYFTNTGGNDLVIHDAYASCGCTVPEWTKNPVKPGDRGKVDVVFDTYGRRGSQYKTVKIKSNAVASEKTITFKANILADN